MKNKLFIIRVSDPENPRENFDCLGIIAYNHKQYVLGEEIISDPINWLEEKLNLKPKGIYTNERLSELEGKFFKEYIALPLYLYDHSGLSIKTTPFSCRWDSGKVGYIYQSKEKIRETYDWNIISNKRNNQIKDYLCSEIELFNDYINGDVFRFRVEDENGDEIDSCCGFYGIDWENNGIKEHIDPELWPQLVGIEVAYNE